jgi:uncharacterized FAD-dependent dehydrogenase
MLRLTEIRLPLDHDANALGEAVRARLGEDAASLTQFSVARRAIDARKKSAIKLTYTVDVELADPAAYARIAAQPGVRPTPDTTYRFVAHAPA